MDRITKAQFKAVLMMELVILSVLVIIGYSFFELACDGSIRSCLSKDSYTEIKFLGISLIRPFFFTPIMIPAMIGGSNFDPITATLLTALGTAFSAIIFYIPGNYLGKKLVRPWLEANLPNTWKLIRSQDYKLIFMTRWIPLFPYDLMSLAFGLANFHLSRVLLFSFLGVLPEVWLFSTLSNPDSQSVGEAFLKILAFSIATIVPLLFYEYTHRRQGSSLWTRLKRVYYEIFYEVQVNNEIKKKHEYSTDKIPIILIYGFFSSRRTLAVMERLLNVRGYQVMSFNLGGVLGTFFTRGIRETAEFIDRKIQRQVQRHNFKKFYIVGHSKGGLVALWWILRLGGSRYCDCVVTMGTPFKGSWLTYLALLSPLGFFWKDVWQMRPGSRFLRELHASPKADNLTIYNFYSNKDGVATGSNGIFQTDNRVISIPMHRMAHFEFLFRSSVADTLVTIFNEQEKKRLEQEAALAKQDRRKTPRI